MANIKSAKKRARQTVVRNARNASQRSMLRTSVKKVLKAVQANDAVAAQEAYKIAEPILDRSNRRSPPARGSTKASRRISSSPGSRLRLSNGSSRPSCTAP